MAKRMRMSVALALVAAFVACAAAQDTAKAPAAPPATGCNLYKTFAPPVNGTSTIFVPDAFQVNTARVMGAAVGELAHGAAAPAVALPLAQGAFAGAPAAGAWTLRMPAGTNVASWALVLCPITPAVEAQGGVVDVQVGPDGVAVNVVDAGNGTAANGTAPATKFGLLVHAGKPAPAVQAADGKGVIGYVSDSKDAVKDATKAKFEGSLAYFTGLSKLNAEAAKSALAAAIDLVDAKGAAARRAVTSIGGGLAATAADLKIGTGNLREKLAAVQEAGAEKLTEVATDAAATAAALAGAAGAATADAASVVGTAGELIKKRVSAAFGVYTTVEGMAKAQADTMLANHVSRFTDMVRLATAGLESLKAGKGPLVSGGISFEQAKLEAFSSALERVAAAAQRVPMPSALLASAFGFGQSALASATSDMLASISRYQALARQLFPGKVAAFSALSG